MSYLTIEGTEYEITPASRLADEPVGDFELDYDGGARSDKRGTYRVGRITTDFMTLTEALALQEILRSPGALTLGGDFLDGDSVDFHVVGPVERIPLASDLVAVSFQVRETNPTPSNLIFSFDGDAPGGYTFTRSGTVGPYTDVDGILQSAAANRFRREWLWRNGVYTVATRPDTAAHILEAAFTNLVDSDNFSAWTSAGTPVITSAISDPAGGTSAYRIADDDAGVAEGKFRGITFTGNAQKILVFVVREATMPGAGAQQLLLWDDTASANRLALDISAWVSGAPTVAASTGTYIGKRYIGNGYWAVYGLSTSVTAANTNRIYIYPAATAAQTGSIDVYRVNAYNAASPPWSILDASEVKNTETWYAAHAAIPQVSTWLIDFIECEHPTWGGNYRLLQLSDGSANAPALEVYRSSGTDSYLVNLANGISSVQSTVDINPAWGDRIRLRVVLNANGSVQVGGKKDSGSGFGAETVGSASAALALPHDWSAERVYLNGPVVFGTTLYLAVRGIKGVKTMAQAEAYLTPRLHNRLAA